MKFSIITPIHIWNSDRAQNFLKTIDSVDEQTFDDFEWVIVDDGSTVDFLWDNITNTMDNVKIIHKEHQERVIAADRGFEESSGEWICLLDSDDEYAPEYLEKVNEMIFSEPEYKMFNFGCAYYHDDGEITYRDAFKLGEKKVGHEEFGGGRIVNGTYVFHRSVYEDLGGYGPKGHDGFIHDIDCTDINYGGVRDLYLGTPYDYSAYMQMEFPELRRYFMVDHVAEPNKIIKELGNPWGQDFGLFYKYTRKYHSKPFDEYLYIVHPR